MIDEAQSARALERFARNAIELRRRAGLTQLDAGRRAGIHRTEVGLLERRLRMPRLDTVLRVAAGVEADPAELLEGLCWELDRDLLWSGRPVPGRYVVTVGGYAVTRVADGWRRVGR
jgi:transcriptional regulator with XRE-family HTH domain